MLNKDNSFKFDFTGFPKRRARSLILSVDNRLTYGNCYANMMARTGYDVEETTDISTVKG